MTGATADFSAATEPARQLARPVTILIPVFGRADMLKTCLESIAAAMPAGCQIHVLDDASPDDSIRLLCEQFDSAGVRYSRNANNEGFVRTCNLGLKQLWDGQSDLLLLNSDAELTGHCIEEMQAVLLLHEKHAVATPRSNCATIFSVPFSGEPREPAESFAIWRKLHPLLPRYSVMPTAVGFCMMIRREILHRFGLFDEIYDPGYNEENDFVCRINRYGYSAISANWAYAFHHDMSSFGERRSALEEVNSRELHRRYPEYPVKVDRYVRFRSDPLEHYASLFHPHRTRVLFDIFHLSPRHNGTSEFALNLLRELSCRAETELEIYVGINGVSLDYFAPDLSGYRIYEGPVTEDFLFDLVFKPSQMFRWDEFARANRCSPRVCITIQDAIAIRCDYLNSAVQENVFAKSALLADHLVVISEASKRDVETLLNVQIPMQVIHQGSDWSHAPEVGTTRDYVLVVGNEYAHKGVQEALLYLGEKWPVVVLGGEKPESVAPNLRWVPSGQVTQRNIFDLFYHAQIVVYPSYYEGFGLPVMDAAAIGRPVIVMDSELTREVSSLLQFPLLHRLETVKELPFVVGALWGSEPARGRTPVRSWADVAAEYLTVFQKLLAAEVDYDRLRARWDLMRIVESMA